MPQLRCPNEKCGHSWMDEQTAEHESTSCPSCGTTVTPSEDAATVLFTPKSEASHDAFSVESPPVAGPPQAIGPYRIDGELGRGAFGVVYECFDTRLKRAVAIKVLHATRSADGQLVQRFLREARAAANLNHPNIVAVYDLGCVGDKYYIASACVDGTSLDKQVKLLAGDWRRSAEIIRDLARALGYAHRQKIVHRDVKPQNVMLNKAGQPLLMDFGLARWKSDLMEAPVSSASAGLTDDAGLTVAHQILGTPAYMAPEQAAAQQDQVGPASDQYSLGVMLFLFLTGRLPLRGSAVEVIKALRDPGLVLPVPRAVNTEVPRDLDAICCRALARRPEDRYPDCDALAGDLEDWLNGRPVTARPLTRGERFRLWCRREPVVAALTLGVAAAIAVGGVSSGLLAWRASDRASVAEAALEKESRALKRAQQQEALAVAESLRADGESANALQARDVATRRAEDAEHMAYLADMELAQQAWDRGAPEELRRRLDRWQPMPDGPDRRRFEWHYWDRLLKSFPGAHAVLSPNTVSRHLPIPHSDLVLVQQAYTGKDLMLYRTVTAAGSGRLEHVRTLSLSGGVISMAVGPQGQLATFDLTGTITLWSLPDLTKVRSYSAGMPLQLGSLVFDKAGKKLLVCGETVMEQRYGLRRLDLESGQFESLWTEPDLIKILSATMQSIELSPDGTHALARGLNVAAWLNLETRAVDRVFTFPSPSTRFKACRLLADAQTVVGQSSDGQLVVWEVATGQRRLILIGNSTARQDELRLNADTSFACVGASFGQSQLWDLRTGVMLKARRGCALPPEQFHADQPLRDARVIVSQSQLWNPRYDPDGVELTVNGANQPLVAAQLSVAFHPKTGDMALGGRFGSVLMLDPTSWTLKRTLSIEDPLSAFGVQRLRFHPEGKGLIAAASHGRAAYWDLQSDHGVFLPGEFRAESLTGVFIPGRAQVAVSSEARDIALWNLSDTSRAGQLVGHTTYQYEWALHSGVPEDVRKRSLTPPIQRDFSATTIVGYNSMEGMVLDLSAHPDGRHLASACGDGTVRIWDLESQKEIHKIFDTSATVQSVEYDRAGKLLAIGYSRGDIHLRDARTFELKSKFTGHEFGVLDLEFTPDQERLVSTSSDRTIRFWDLKTGQPVLRLDIWNSMFDPFAVVDQLAFHPDGTMLAGRTMSFPRAVRIWQSAGAMNQSQVLIDPPGRALAPPPKTP